MRSDLRIVPIPGRPDITRIPPDACHCIPDPVQSVRDLIGYRVAATDGNIGRVHDLYFDDIRWTVRHIEARIRGWPLAHDVLLPPQQTLQLSGRTRRLAVGLTISQIRASPEAASDLPVAGQKQREYSRYYTQAFAWGAMFPPGSPTTLLVSSGFKDPDEEPDGPADPDLRSAREVMGYRLSAVDGWAGTVRDFLVNPDKWVICRLLVETGGWVRSRRVLLCPDCIEGIEWAWRCVRVRLTCRQIQDLPEHK
jgi:hypothetical protein